MFDNTQHSFQSLRKILLEGTSPVYLWIGAGLSMEAGMPSWLELRARLIERGRKWLALQTALTDVESRSAKLRVAELEEDLWSAFERIYEALGESEYRKGILDEFSAAVHCEIPFAYNCLLGIRNIKGVVTTNIDKLATRAYVMSKNEPPLEFGGRQCGSFNYVLQGSRFFVANLHGTAEDYASWVMRKKDWENLSLNQGYLAFIRGMFATGVVVFVGANPMDQAIQRHLDVVRRTDLIPGSGSMFWITDNTSDDAFKFSNSYNISRIIYSSDDNHRDLKNVVGQLNSGKSYDDDQVEPAVVNLPRIEKSIRHFEKIDFRSMPESEAREYLNKRAYEILQSNTPNAYKAYEQFLKCYQKQIYQAWYVAEGERLLDLTLKEEIGEGGFGRVFRAVDSNGVEYAVKVLKEDVMRKSEYLQSFRRGVRAMRILSTKSIKGIVKFRSAIEIPASVVMEFVEGETLQEIVLQHQLSSWQEKMKILKDVGKVIRDAHALPERVLHRDIRPHNIMIRGHYGDGCREICVLDFDLAFHRDANEVSIQMGVGNGYTAPEQIASTGQKGLSRSSRVDSYGFAMLCYFVITGKEPVPRQCMMNGWGETVDIDVGGRQCKDWVSLPFKMAEIIKICTRQEQNERWDLYQMYGSIDALYQAISNPKSVCMPDLISDELLYRVAVSRRSQKAVTTSHDGCRVLTLPSGTTYGTSVQNGIVTVVVGWRDDGKLDFKRCKKILGDRSHALVNKLRKQGFNKVDAEFDGNSVTIEIQLETLKYKIDNIIAIATILSEYDISPHNG